MTSLLQEIFIRVPENKCDSFMSIFVAPESGVIRDTSYDGKIVFLEKTQEIFAQGRLYGLNNTADVAALSRYVGTLPLKDDGTPYESVVEMLEEIKNSRISDVITVGANNSFTISDTTYTLHANDGELTLDPYIPLTIESMELLSVDNKVLSSVLLEYDNPKTMTLGKIRYKFGGNTKCIGMSIKVGSNWVLGWGAAPYDLYEVDIEPNTEQVFELDEFSKVTISSATGTDYVDVELYAMDEKQENPVCKKITLKISHQRVYLLGYHTPSNFDFIAYNSRTLGYKPESITFEVDREHYGWFAYPLAWGKPLMRDGDSGLYMTMVENDDWNVTGLYSDGITYKVYRTGHLCAKSQTILLTW